MDSLKEIKSPVPVKVTDITNFTRLAIALTDSPQILWRMQHSKREILALFTAYMYWDGDIPLLAYIDRPINESVVTDKPFLAYKCDSVKGEELFFSNDIEDAKYKYASFIELRKPPEPFLRCIEGDYLKPSAPMLAYVDNINSILRILFPLSIREGTNFPLWHFIHKKEHVLGTCIPFEHYYEADALPVFFYCKLDGPPKGPFIKYRAVKPKGEEVSFVANTAEPKYFYVKVVSVESMPLFSAHAR